MFTFNRSRKIDIALILLLVIFSLFASITLLRPGFFYSHDGILHTVRLAVFDKLLRGGHIVPRWSDQLAYGLGSPVLMFYGMLPNYVGSLFHLLGLNYQNAVKAVLSTSFALSAIFFYFFAREKFGQLAGFVGALFYLWAPYRFADVYVRGAVPESFAFIFPPLIFLSGEKLMKRPTKLWLLINSVSVGGIILSHNVLAAIFVGVYVGYLLCCWFWTKKPLRVTWISLILGIGLSSFFLWPALVFQNKIHLEALSIGSYYISNFVTLKQVLYSPWGWGAISSTTPMSVQLGLAQWLGVGALCLLVLKKWRLISADTKLSTIFFLMMLGISVFLMTGFSAPLWKAVNPVQMVLYPWRFLSLAVFAAAILVTVAVSLFPKKYFVVFLLFVLFYANRNYLQVSVLFDKNDDYYASYRGTTDVQGEFLPKAVDLSVIKNCEKISCSFAPKHSLKDGFTNSKVVWVSNLLSVLSVGVLFLITAKDQIFKHKEKVNHQ